MKIKRTIDIDINNEELLLWIVKSFTEDEVIKFIKDIELCYEDWGVTQKLCDHFSEAMDFQIKYLEEIEDTVELNKLKEKWGKK